MKVGIVKESRDPRVAIVPDTLSKLSALGVSVIMEAGAGDESFFSDNDYVGATILSRNEVLKQADIIVVWKAVPMFVMWLNSADIFVVWMNRAVQIIVMLLKRTGHPLTNIRTC